MYKHQIATCDIHENILGYLQHFSFEDHVESYL